MRSAADAALTVLVAPTCAACGEPLDAPLDGPVCAACWRSVHAITPPICDRCGDALPSWRVTSVPLGICARCRRLPRRIAHARAIGIYDGALRAIIHALKYDGRRSLAEPLGRLMRVRGATIIEGADHVVPVPLHRSRRRERGFNQAVDLARHLDLKLCHGLRRVRATASQTGLPAAQRHRNMRQAFTATRAGRRLAGLTVVLVDDVSTTGATLEACAQVLMAEGVREVRALTAARVVTLPR